jgi:predicted nucleic acid-binding protein
MINEPMSEKMRSIVGDDARILTSVLTVVEVASAHWQRRHKGELSISEHEAADRNFAALSTAWVEVPITQDVIDAAVSVLSRHRLRAADALQLAAAKVAAGKTLLAFVTLDEDLAEAAQSEGFPILP